MLENIIAVGDSHVTFLERAGFMRSHWMGPLYVVTIYKLLESGLNLYSLKESLADSPHYINVGVYPWQCPSGRYDVPSVKSGDIVVFSYGFNDVQKNINKYASADPKKEIERLISGYVSLLKEYENKYNITCIPLSIPPNPAPAINNGTHLYGIGGEFEAHGTSEERNMYTHHANETLKEACDKNGLNFLYIYDEISCDEGFLKKEYTEDFVHLRHDNQQLLEKIKDKINESCH